VTRLERSVQILTALNHARSRLGHASPNAVKWEQALEQHDLRIGYDRRRVQDLGPPDQAGARGERSMRDENWRR